MRILRSIVSEHPSGSVEIATAEFAERGAIRRQSIRRKRPRMDALVLEQFAQQPQRSLCIAAFLN